MNEMNEVVVDFDNRRSVLQAVSFSLMPDVNLFVKRDDLIHPIVSGNKWRKLKYHVRHFLDDGNYGRIVTFGGAFSNHLVAAACAGAVLSIPVSGIVRGDELSEDSNEVLKLCRLYGMDLHFVSRDQYRLKEQLIPDMFGGEVYIIPEGGAGAQGVKGCAEIIAELEGQLDYLFAGVGTGTTLAGLARGASGTDLKIEGIASLKNAGYLLPEINQMAGTGDFNLHTGFHGGGFARLPEVMLETGRQFIRETGILLDPVYTIKAIFAMVQLYQRGYFNRGDRIGLLHTGGLTGWLGMNQ